jgi:Ulp1 protease family, C-terminal catalytic domain
MLLFVGAALWPLRGHAHCLLIRTDATLPYSTDSSYSVSSCWLVTLRCGSYAAMRRYLTRAGADVLALDRLIVPINSGGSHWSVAIVNFAEEVLEYYDRYARVCTFEVHCARSRWSVAVVTSAQEMRRSIVTCAVRCN